MELPKPRCDVGKKCMELLKTYKAEDLQIALAKYTADKWLHLYIPKVFNEPLPEVMVRYKALVGEKERDKFNRANEDWLNGEEMKDYAEAKRRVEGENESNRFYLKQTLPYIKDDQERYDKVNRALSSYTYRTN